MQKKIFSTFYFVQKLSLRIANFLFFYWNDSNTIIIKWWKFFNRENYKRGKYDINKIPSSFFLRTYVIYDSYNVNFYFILFNSENKYFLLANISISMKIFFFYFIFIHLVYFCFFPLSLSLLSIIINSEYTYRVIFSQLFENYWFYRWMHANFFF